MTLEAVKRMGLLLFAVFSMAAIYEVVLHSDSRENLPIYFAYNLNTLSYSRDVDNSDTGLAVPCKVEYGFCECFIEIPPSTIDATKLLTIFDKKITDFNRMPNSEPDIFTIIRGNGQKLFSAGNEVWFVGQSGYVTYRSEVVEHKDDIPIMFPLTFNNVLTIKDILERHATGIDGVCSMGQISYPETDYRKDVIF